MERWCQQVRERRRPATVIGKVLLLQARLSRTQGINYTNTHSARYSNEYLRSQVSVVSPGLLYYRVNMSPVKSSICMHLTQSVCFPPLPPWAFRPSFLTFFSLPSIRETTADTDYNEGTLGCDSWALMRNRRESFSFFFSPFCAANAPRSGHAEYLIFIRRRRALESRRGGARPPGHAVRLAKPRSASVAQRARWNPPAKVIYDTLKLIRTVQIMLM